MPLFVFAKRLKRSLHCFFAFVLCFGLVRIVVLWMFSASYRDGSANETERKKAFTVALRCASQQRNLFTRHPKSPPLQLNVLYKEQTSQPTRSSLEVNFCVDSQNQLLSVRFFGTHRRIVQTADTSAQVCQYRYLLSRCMSTTRFVSFHQDRRSFWRISWRVSIQ